MCVYVCIYIYMHIDIPGLFPAWIDGSFLMHLKILPMLFLISNFVDLSQPIVVHSDSFTSGFQYGANSN